MSLPELRYAKPPEGVNFPTDWSVPSAGVLERYATFHDNHGFYDAHAPEVHTPAEEVPVDEIASDTIQQAGRYLQNKAEDLRLIYGDGISANQLIIPGITKAIPSMSLMSVEGGFQVVVNPQVTLPEDFSPLHGEDDIWSQGCLNLLGCGGAVNSPTRLGLTGYTLEGRPIDTEITSQPGDRRATRNVYHEWRHTLGKLYGELVLDAGRPLYSIPPERFAEYGKFIRNKPTEFVPREVPRAQYNALLDPHDPRMKLANFTIARS